MIDMHKYPLPSGWKYSGDRGLEYGGYFVKVDPSDFKWGYLTVVQVTDLDSGCGFTGAVLIESKTAIIDRKGKDRRYIRQALQSIGQTPADLRQLLRTQGKEAYMMQLAILMVDYGRSDPRQPSHVWDSTPDSMTVQCQEGAPMVYDGWKASKFVAPNDLPGFVEAYYLND